MVVGPKISLQHVPSKGRISIMKIQNFTVRKRQSVLKIIYGALLVAVSIIMVTVNPLKIATSLIMDLKEGSFIFKVWQKLPYQVYVEVWVYNYTNLPEYLSGQDSVMKLEQVGPFIYEEIRSNKNMTLDKDRKVLTFMPHVDLEFQKNLSIGDPKDINIYAPNTALLAISTLLADKLGYFANAGAYYSINALGSKLVRNLTAHEMLWGYEDPIVTVANGVLPGWIDFPKIGIMDRFYAERVETVELDVKSKTEKFSIISWNGKAGIPEQGYTDLNTSILCNRLRGTYEGFMLAPGVPKDKIIKIFRRQACRVYPFSFKEEINKFGFNHYRFMMQEDAFNATSPYACKCGTTCLPYGFVDVSDCYYGFPITLSKPHFLDTDPVQMSYFEGMHPDKEKHSSSLDIEPVLGVPLSLSSKMQVNLAVRMNAGNPITRPFKDKVIPILWLSLYCKEPPPEIMTLLTLRLVIAPPLLITLEVVLFAVGVFLGVHGFYRTIKPRYMVVESGEKRKRKNNVFANPAAYMAENTAFTEYEQLKKEAVSLLALEGVDTEVSNIITRDT